ncbi:conserved hypothetical protein [Planktothrix agardhii]|nr:conserved hypothetical protein [Planktothrix agardhii]
MNVLPIVAVVRSLLMPPSSKFTGVDFSELPVEHLTANLTISAQGFRCLRGEFVTYWRQGRIQREIDARISQCWILRHENTLAGYITLLADKLVVDETILLDEGVSVPIVSSNQDWFTGRRSTCQRSRSSFSRMGNRVRCSGSFTYSWRALYDR